MIGLRRSVHEQAFRKSDAGMFLAFLWGLIFVLRGNSLVMTKETGPAMYALSALCFMLVVALPFLVRARRRATGGDRDEYLRKLVGQSAIAGFYAAVAIFVVWTPLSGSLLPGLSGAQVLGLMLTGAALRWFFMRWRDTH